MKHEKLHNEIQDLQNDLTYIRGLLHTMSHQIQDLHEQLEQTYKPEKPYVHPWYKYKKDLLVSTGNYQD